jgi:hypothetical protein
VDVTVGWVGIGVATVPPLRLDKRGRACGRDDSPEQAHSQESSRKTRGMGEPIPYKEGAIGVRSAGRSACATGRWPPFPAVFLVFSSEGSNSA